MCAHLRRHSIREVHNSKLQHKERSQTKRFCENLTSGANHSRFERYTQIYVMVGSSLSP